MMTCNNKWEQIIEDVAITLFVIGVYLMDNSDVVPVNYTYTLLIMIMSYVTTRFLFLFVPTWSSLMTLLSLILITTYEIIFGALQLYGVVEPGNYILACTGSFPNSGPYGGFLAIVTCVMSAYSILGANRIFKRVCIVTLILSLVMLPATQSRSALLGLACGMVMLVFRVDYLRVKAMFFLKKYGSLFILGLCLAATTFYLFKKPSADGRLFMDKISIKAICSNNIRGVGVGFFGGKYGETQADYFIKQIQEDGEHDLDWRVINERDRITSDCPDNSFNEYLFIGVESGPIMMFLLVCIIIVAVVVSYKRKTIWCYGLMAFAIFAFFSYPLHIRQFQIIFSILLAACVSDRNLRNHGGCVEQTISVKKHFVTLTPLFVLFVISLIICVNGLSRIRQFKRVESLWETAERWYKMDYYDFFVEDCDSIWTYMNHDYRFLFEYGQSLNKTGNYEKSNEILQLGAKLSSDPMFWNVMGNNSLALGNYREAERYYKRAFYMVPNRLYPLYLLAKMYYEEGDSGKFLLMTDIVESFIPKVESSNTERLRDEIKDLREGFENKVLSEDSCHIELFARHEKLSSIYLSD